MGTQVRRLQLTIGTGAKTILHDRDEDGAEQRLGGGEAFQARAREYQIDRRRDAGRGGRVTGCAASVNFLHVRRLTGTTTQEVDEKINLIMMDVGMIPVDEAESDRDGSGVISLRSCQWGILGVLNFNRACMMGVSSITGKGRGCEERVRRKRSELCRAPVPGNTENRQRRGGMKDEMKWLWGELLKV